ncbi:MAG: MarR family winged helix-turn-helix transcriptional regulator [Alphaproteobacteria bacterium]|nr:MarR family winged helix-turn-helix transcriptional regulator [Alphaproteobacteria bacterium]
MAPASESPLTEIEAAEAEAAIALDAFLPYRLSVLANTVSRAMARLYAERFDLTIPEWRVMAVLGAYAPLSASQVVARTAMDKVQVSRAVARLLETGRLDRQRDPADGRRSLLRLSGAGRQVYRQIVPLAQAVEARLLAPLDAAERAQLDRLLEKLQARAAELP